MAKEELNKKALGTYKNAEGCWVVAVIDYNPTTGVAKVNKEESMETNSIYTDDRDYKFKVTAANLGLVG